MAGILKAQDLVTNKLPEINYHYNCIISAIPKQWKYFIKHRINQTHHTKDKYYIINLGKSIMDASNKDIYNKLSFTNNVPTAQNKWVEYFPFLEAANWCKLYKLPQQCTHETKLQSFQYTILQRFVGCSYNLFLWKLRESPNWAVCEEVDSIEHMFFFGVVKLLVFGNS